MDKKCICRKKFDTYPAQLVNCSIHPGCSCLEAQDINCIFCNKQLLEEEEEEERGEGEGEGEEDSHLDLNCQEDFETAVADSLQEIVLGNWKFCLPGSAQEDVAALVVVEAEEEEEEEEEEEVTNHQKCCVSESVADLTPIPRKQKYAAKQKVEWKSPRNYFDDTPFSLAKESGHDEICKMITESSTQKEGP